MKIQNPANWPEVAAAVEYLPSPTHRRIGRALRDGTTYYVEQLRAAWGRQADGGGLVEAAVRECARLMELLAGMVAGDELGRTPVAGPPEAPPHPSC